MTRSRGLLLLVALLGLAGQAASQSAGQPRPLSIVSHAPDGELAQLSDANDVRIMFSEPMIAIGGAAVTGKPVWITVTPERRGFYFWSGTRTLIFSPDPETPFPYATNVKVRVDATATSAAGRTLGRPFEFEFTTPTVRLLQTEWYRKNGRFDDPVVLLLRFNQPVRPSDVAAHTHARLAPHNWPVRPSQRPALQPEARTRLERTDPDGLARFDAKVAAFDRVLNSSEPVPLRLAETWHEKRYGFERAPDRVVLETVTPPLPESWLTIEVDGTMPSPAGPAKHAAHSTPQALDRAFFIDPFGCVSRCDPSAYNGLRLRGTVPASALGRTLSVRDVTTNDAGLVVEPASAPSGSDQNGTSIQQGGFRRQPPMSTWAIRVDSSLAARDGQTLGYPFLGVVENGHESTALGISGAVWEAAGGTKLPLLSRNVLDVTQWLAPVAPGEIMPRLSDLAASRYASVPSVPSTSRPLTITPDTIEAHGTDASRALGPNGTGIIWAAFSRGGILPYGGNNLPPSYWTSIIQVTNLGITVKDSAASTLVFVTRLDTAAPVGGASVYILNDSNRVMWSGTTNRDGVALAPALPLRAGPYRPPPLFIVTAHKDGDVAYVGSDWGNTVMPYQWNIGFRQADGAILRGSVFTDRGAYREGEEVHVKAILRRDAEDGATPLVPGTKLDVRVRDSRGREVDHRTVETNRWSSVEWTGRLPVEAALGWYNITVSGDPAAATTGYPKEQETVRGGFLVAAYRRPDFRVDATMTADPPVLGGTLHGTVDAKYLFGKALGSQPVRWWVTRNPVASVPTAVRQAFQEATYAFGYVPEPGVARDSRVLEKTETLDANGCVDVQVPTAADVDFAFDYQLNGDVTSVSAQHIANTTRLVVHPAGVYVGIKRPSMFVNVKDGARTDIVVSDLGGRAVAGVSVRVSLSREQWVYGVGQWKRQETAVADWTIRSAANPAQLAIPIKDGGAYVLRAEAADASGRHTRTDVRFYGIGGGAASWRMDGNKITIVPERETWKPGESARVMIQSPWEQATALLTIEREGVRRYRQFAISSTQDTIDVPITAADVPNVFVSVLLVKGRTADALAPDGTDAGLPAFRVGYTTLTVDDESKRLKVTVSSDRDEYAPHAPAKVSVAVRDSAGKPAASEVTLWAVDYGLLSLTNYQTPDVVKAIYTRRDLRVLTEDTRERMISRRTLVPEAAAGDITVGLTGGAGGGGRGGAARAVANTQLVESFGQQTKNALGFTLDGINAGDAAGAATGISFRKDFRPVVFWLGSVTTGADGRATTDVTLPDSLTTYRIMAVADQAELFGSGEREIRVTKPLTLLPAFPRYLSRGDRASFGATVTNGSSSGGDAVITMRSLDPAALQFETVTVKTVRLAPGETAPVRFDGVARSIAPVRLQMTVTLGSETDAFETTLPVTAPSRLETVAAYGDTTSSAIEKLMLPVGYVPGVGGLTVNLASTALVGLGESVRYIDEYSYECAEAKASRALALVLTADLGSAFTLPGVKPEAYRANAANALDALYSFQCGDGGFAFWPGRCETTSAYLTAYVLDVWRQSQALKMTVDRNAIERALDYLQAQQRQPAPPIQWWPAWAASQAYAAKVMAEFGRNVNADLSRLYGMAERMPVFALSYLADGLAASGDRGPRYQDVVRRISNALRVEADRAHVEEVDDDSLAWLWNSNVRATAVVLEGVARRKDDGTLAAPLARWLMAARTNGRWGTTYENATALAALVSYYRTFEADVPQMTTTVKLGTSTVGTADFAGRSTTSQEFAVKMADLTRITAGTTRDLAIARTGTGRVYYTTRLQYLAPEPPDPVDRGFRVDRKFAVFVPGGPASPAATTFDVGDVIRVTVGVTLSAEGKFLAVDDRLPAGFEPIDESLSTTALDLAREATTTPSGGSYFAWWRRGGFTHIEKHDDRVLAFATRLGAGRHEFTYLVRATTAGTFTAAGARVEAMYAPEVSGRSAAGVITIR